VASQHDSFGARSPFDAPDGRTLTSYRLDRLDPSLHVDRLPFSLKILLENLLRHEGAGAVTATDVESLTKWDAAAEPAQEISFAPARILLQDFTGVPAVVDLAAMRDAMAAMGGDAGLVNPLVPVELVIDHSVVADIAGVPEAFAQNAALEFDRNRERYQFLRWGQGAFDNFKVVPPDTGICHQVNLEYLARVVFVDDDAGAVYPDTLVGTDSHTTMVNGLGVLGWGVGGIEAEAAMLGQPMSMLVPRVVGMKLIGALPEGSTATDLVLTVTQLLRRHGVVGKFVEFYGEGLASVPLANRATIGNMSPEYGSTCAIFPIDQETLRYLTFTGRPADHVALVEAYAKEQGLWHEPAHVADYSERLELDLSTVEPSLAGPKRPQDRVPVHAAKAMFRHALVAALPEAPRARTPSTDRGTGPDDAALPASVRDGTADEALAETFPASDPTSPGSGPDNDTGGAGAGDAGTGTAGEVDRLRNPVPVTLARGPSFDLDHGAVVIAAITSCTNTSNPSVMIAAGLLAKNAVERGLTAQPWVKTSLAPGSKVVIDYYERSGLLPYLEKLGFNLVGFGCTTCIGNSGPLQPELSEAIDRGDLAVVAVLSGNRNFEGRINPDVRMNYLASPPLVVAYALAGTMDIDLRTEPLGIDVGGAPVLLADIWPSAHDVARVVSEAIASDMFRKSYGEVFSGDDNWNGLAVPTGHRFEWDGASTYVRNPPYFEAMTTTPAAITDIRGARVLAKLGDSVTTDHISPAGNIRRASPAGRWLEAHGVSPGDFNSYGSRRGNHEVMIRGTFANIRLRNQLAPGTEGGITRYLPGGDEMTIYDAAVAYASDRVPLVVLAGKEYGSGSSRDWAAKGTLLLGVRAVLAESFERIHRSNLVGMGVLPLQYLGETAESLGLTGEEVFDITGLAALAAGEALPKELEVHADGREFRVRLRIDTPMEQAYYRHGGILPYVLRQLMARSTPSEGRSGKRA
jgi:aconitate hydratase